MDSNHRRQCRQIYSLIPLAAREPHQGIFILKNSFPSPLLKFGANNIQTRFFCKGLSLKISSYGRILLGMAKKRHFLHGIMQFYTISCVFKDHSKVISVTLMRYYFTLIDINSVIYW